MSSPKHENYGQHLSVAELAELVGASDLALSEVVAHLLAHGVAEHDIRLAETRDFLSVSMSVAVAERVFGVSMGAYEHHATGRRILRSEQPHRLPAHVARHIDLVRGRSNGERGGAGGSDSTTRTDDFGVSAAGVWHQRVPAVGARSPH